MSFNTVDVVPESRVWDCCSERYSLWRAKVMREQVIEVQDRIILSCECGERIVLLGRAIDWYEEDRLEFSCECSRILSVSDHLLDSEDFDP
jgi:hypothetical protein